jgi:hypothetical protein
MRCQSRPFVKFLDRHLKPRLTTSIALKTKNCTCTGCEDKCSLFYTVLRLFYESVILVHISANTRVDGVVLKGWVDLGLVSCHTKNLFLLEQIRSVVLSYESLQDIIDG